MSCKKDYQSHQNYADESNALLVSGLYTPNVYKSLKKTTQKPSGKITCSICNKSTKKFVWSSKNMRYIECSACKQCWIKSRKKVYQSHQNKADESNALLVGELYTQNFYNF